MTFSIALLFTTVTRTLNKAMVWPPTKDFTDFIASLVENSELCFDPKITETVSGADEESRYAGHCLLWAKTSALGIGEIKLKALVNVGNFFAYLPYLHQLCCHMTKI